MSTFPKWPLVLVEWVDSVSDSSWQHWSTDKKIYVTNVTSVGYLAHRTKDIVTIISHIGLHPDNRNPQCHGEMSIPAAAVKRIRRIKL